MNHKPNRCTCGAACLGERCLKCYRANVRKYDRDDITDAELSRLIESRRATMPPQEHEHGNGEYSRGRSKYVQYSTKRHNGKRI